MKKAIFLNFTGLAFPHPAFNGGILDWRYGEIQGEPAG